MSNIIFLFGPSCSGKSTLGKALQMSLGTQWTYIDRDDLIEGGECTDLTADAALDKRIQSIGKCVIVDAQIPWRAKRKNELKFLILPPLKIILERDAARTTLLNRPVKQANYAKEYVIETHQQLSQLEKGDFDGCFDSSVVSVQSEIATIKSFLSPAPASRLELNYKLLAVVGLAFCIIYVALSKVPS